VVGLVVDARGEAASDVAVRAFDAAGEVVTSVRSDRQGRFWLKRLPLAPLTLRADGGRRGMGELRLGERSPEESLVLRLAAQGVLVATWRGPIGVSLMAIPEQTPWEPSWTPGDNPYARPISSGHEVLVVAPRYWRVEIHDGDLVEPCGEGLLTPGGRLEIDCGDSGWAEVVGQVVDEDGRPVAGDWSFTAEDYLQGPFEVLGALQGDGRFVARINVKRGTSGSLQIASEGRATLQRQAISISPGRRTDLGRMVILSDATVAERFPGGWHEPFGGIGARISSSKLGISLTAIARGGPLDAAGVLAGDIVIAVDGTPAGTLPTHEAVKLLRGRPGTPLRLQLLRPDAMILDIDIERGIVDTQSVDWVD
jgi:hypothetical protein